MVMQAANLQMDALANRGKIMAEGIEVGMLKQQTLELEKKNIVLQKKNDEMFKQALALSRRNDDDDDGETPEPPKDAISALVEQYGPAFMEMLKNKFLGTSGDAGTGNSGENFTPPPQ